jgi:hypothetical protein
MEGHDLQHPNLGQEDRVPLSPLGGRCYRSPTVLEGREGYLLQLDQNMELLIPIWDKMEIFSKRAKISKTGKM